jgi:integrase
MRAKLTDQLCSQKPLKDGRIELWDLLVPGLCIRIYPSGARTFSLMPRDRKNGVQRRITLMPRYPLLTLAEARNQARQKLVEWERGHPLPQLTKPTETTEHYLRLWLANEQAQNRTVAKTERTLRRHLAPWLKHRLESVTRADLQQVIDDIACHYASGNVPVQGGNKRPGGLRPAANFYVLARGFFRWCFNRAFLKTDPTDNIQVKPPEGARDRHLPNDELRAVWQASAQLSWPYSALVQMLVLTGQRMSEVTKLPWSELNIDQAEWLLPAARAKNKREHLIPLAPAVVELIKAQPEVINPAFTKRERIRTLKVEHPDWSANKIAEEIGTVHPNYVWRVLAGSLRLRTMKHGGDASPNPFGLVFPGAKGGYVGDWNGQTKRLRKLSGINDWRLHDLRRTATVGMQRLGIKREVIEAVLNHKPAGIVGVYHVYEYAKEKRTALEAWAREVDRIVTGEEAKVIPMSKRGA